VIAACVASSPIAFQSVLRREGGRVPLQSLDVEVARDEDAGAPVSGPDRRRELTRVIRVVLLGYGQVGQAVAAVAEKRRGSLRAANLELRFVDALVRDPAKRRTGPQIPLSTDADGILSAGVDVIVEVLGGLEPAHRLVAAALDAGIPVVTANKTLVAEAGVRLRSLAARRGTRFAFDAAVIAGVPFLGSLARRPLAGEAREVAGVLNGTSNYILTRMSAGATFEAAIADAIARGYAEPDSSADISGLDAAQKLGILLQVAGYPHVRAADFPRESLMILNSNDLAAARRLGGAIKPIAFAALDPDYPSAWVGPAFVHDRHPLGRIAGVTNALQVTGVTGDAVLFAGPGAGPEVTAATIIDDIAEIVSHGPCAERARSDVPTGPPVRFDQPPDGGWFVTTGNPGLRPGHVAEFFASRGVPLLHLTSCAGGQFALTAPAGAVAVREAVDGLRTTGAPAYAIPAIAGGSSE
jgi:homoserine dehydrogenase